MLLSSKGSQKFLAATHNLVFAGNSLIAGDGATTAQRVANTLHNLPLLKNSGLTVKSYGIAGDSYTDMIVNQIASIQAAYEVGKKNILIHWEATNQIYLGNSTASQTVTHMLDFLSAVNTGQTWEHITLTCLHRWTDNAKNLVLQEFNGLVLNNHKNYGIKRVVDIRKGDSPFSGTGFTQADFDAYSAYTKNTEVGTGNETHLNDAGYDKIAKMIEQQGLRMLGPV